jgi:hypothetical protein
MVCTPAAFSLLTLCNRDIFPSRFRPLLSASPIPVGSPDGPLLTERQMHWWRAQGAVATALTLLGPCNQTRVSEADHAT